MDKLTHSVEPHTRWLTRISLAMLAVIALVSGALVLRPTRVQILGGINSSILQVVSANPNGTVTAGKGSLAVDTASTPPTFWQNTTGGTVWTQFPSTTIISQASGDFGTGVDGTVTWDGVSVVLGITPSANTYVLPRDVYTHNATVNTGVKISENGFRYFDNGTLTLSGTANINDDGATGPNSTGSTPATAVAIRAVAILGRGTLAGGSGGSPTGSLKVSFGCTTTAGATAGGNTGGGGGTGTAGGNGVACAGGGGGGGGNGAGTVGGVGRAGPTTTLALATDGMSIFSISYARDGRPEGPQTSTTEGNGGSGGAAGGVGITQTGAGGAGGAGGNGGGTCTVSSRSITGSGSISANGGNGGNGGNATGTSGGGGGGAGGGGGYAICEVAIGACPTLSATGGTGGTFGTGAGGGGNGGPGGSGGAGLTAAYQP